MKTILALLLVLLLVLTIGCLMPETPAPGAVDTGISEDVSGVETLSDDLDTSELDSLDQDLAEINW